MSDELDKKESEKNKDVCSFELYLIESRKFPCYLKILLLISICAIFTFMFFGLFFSPSDIFSVIAIGIGAILFITLVICATIIISKCIVKKEPSKESCNFNSIKLLFEAYQAVFENSKK